MAKTDLFLKRKFNRFALMLAEDYAGRNRRLQAVAKILAIGFLETLWQKAYADGSDYLGDGIDVELAVDWPGKRGSFAEMLLRCGGDGPGFIEEIPDRPGRYRIHDFWDHAPAHVKRRARRNAKGTPVVETKPKSILETQADRAGSERTVSTATAARSPESEGRPAADLGTEVEDGGESLSPSVNEADSHRIELPAPLLEPDSEESEPLATGGEADLSSEPATDPQPPKNNGTAVVFELQPLEKRTRTEPSTPSPASRTKEHSGPPQPRTQSAHDQERRAAPPPSRPSPARSPSGLLAAPPPPGVPAKLPPEGVREDEIELVFVAHEFGMRIYSDVTGEPFAACSRSPEQRRKRIRDVIEIFGFPVARRAARNLSLSSHHRGKNEDRKKYLGIDSAMRDPEYLAGLYDGPNEGLADAIRESLKIFEPDPEDNPEQGIDDGLQGAPMSAEEEALAEEVFG